DYNVFLTHLLEVYNFQNPEKIDNINTVDDYDNDSISDIENYDNDSISDIEYDDDYISDIEENESEIYISENSGQHIKKLPQNTINNEKNIDTMREATKLFNAIERKRNDSSEVQHKSQIKEQPTKQIKKDIKILSDEIKQNEKRNVLTDKIDRKEKKRIA